MVTTKPTLWLQARAKKQRKREQLRLEVLDQVDAVLKELAARYTWNEVYLFGSVLQSGKFDQDSDVDLAVAGLPKQGLYRFTAELMDQLGRAVDVVVMEEVHFAKTIIRKGLQWEPEKRSSSSAVNLTCKS